VDAVKWYEAIERVQLSAERAGFACMEFATWLVRSVLTFLKNLFDRDGPGRGEGYLRGFPKR
jgi:hypothetical protein